MHSNALQIVCCSYLALLTPSVLLKYFGYALGSATSFKNNQYMIHGKPSMKELLETLDVFIDKYVLCSTCTLPETIMIVHKGKLSVECMGCSAITLVPHNHKIVDFMEKNPPDNTKWLKKYKDLQKDPFSGF